jgi:DNA-binding transcriptional ArsR family regulator
MPMNQRGSPVALAARLFRGFADPTRLAVVRALGAGEKRVADLVAEVGSSQPNVSGHLACLKECGLVSDRPEGRQVFYRISAPEVLDLLAAAERLLAVHGHRVRLCPRLRARRRPLVRRQLPADGDRRRPRSRPSRGA